MTTIREGLRRRMLYSVATAHAPKGGASVGGKSFTGGEFIPSKVMAKATPAEKAKIAGKSAPSAGTQGRLPFAAKAAAGPSKPAKPKAVSGQMAGAMRVGKGKDAAIVLADGRPAPAHIKPSMVPPDWTDVQIGLDPKADVLVKARDKAGRIKTVYSAGFDMKNEELKFARIHEMLNKHGQIANEIHRDRMSDDPATRDAAELTWLIEQQGTRPGSDGDTKARVKAYGATTLRAEHVVETPDGVRLQFVGKEGVYHDHLIGDPALADMLVQRKATAGQRGGKLFSTTADKLNKYISKLDGGLFTAKDFRTLRATRLAIEHVKAIGDCCDDAKSYKAKVMEVATRVSRVLGNKPAQSLESYINPTVFAVWRNPGA